MNTTLPFRPGLTAALLCTVLLPAASAQLAPEPEPTATDEAVLLSPFVVSTETESGYLAAETLAGMRLRTNLKDVGAAIDVLTEDFLDDVGALDMNDALRYVANMQYADFPSPSDATNQTQWFSSSYLSRGVLGSTVLQDFFPTGSLPLDRYNTDNLTFMRGPNAILFGIGSPSGVVGASSKRASLTDNRREVRFTFDTEESARTEIDVSHVLIENQLAVRVAAVASDRHTAQEPSLNRRNAVYGTVTYRPFRRTSITINAESGVWERLHVQNNLVADAYTPWVLAGRPTVNWVTGAGQTQPGKGRYPTNPGSGLQNQSTGGYLVYIEGSGLPIMDWRGMARGSQWSNMLVAGAAGSGLILNTDRSQMSFIGFNEDNTIIDLRANPWGGLNTNDLDYNRQTIFIEQNLLEDLDVELAWNRYEQEYLFDVFSMNSTIFVDPNEVLPDGSPNPFVGMPYLETGNGGNAMRKYREWREYENLRLTLSYDLDLNDHKLFRDVGLGRYRFAGLYQDSTYDQKFVSSRFVNVTPQPGNPTANPYSQNSNRVSHRYYLQPGESMFEFGGNRTFTQPTIPGAAPANAGTIQVEEHNSNESPRNNEQSTESWVAAVQAEWWESAGGWPYLTALYGFRQDTQKDRSMAFPRLPTGEWAGPLNSFDGLEGYGTWNPRSSFTAETKSYNVTVRPLAPLRVFYNYSDIFRSPAAANFTDVFGNPLRPAFGETEDYGIKLDLFDERAFLTITKFETAVVDTGLDNTGNVRTPINHIYEAIGRPDLELVRPWEYRDDSTEGWEFGLNANLTPNWRTRVSFGIQETTIARTYEAFATYFEEHRPLWQENAAVPLVTPGTGYTTVADAIARAEGFLRDARALIGQAPTDQRKYNASLVTSYGFTEGWLKNVRIGGGFRWASANVLGYARDANGNLDTTRPYKGAENLSTDASISYSRKFLDGKLDWEIQLNAYNLLDETDPRARTAVDDGTGGRIVTRTYFPYDPFGIQVTNTIRF